MKSRAGYPGTAFCRKESVLRVFVLLAISLLLACLAPAAAQADTGGVSVTYRADSVWSNGFTATVEIVNGTASPLADWEIRYDSPHRVTSIWNAELVSQVGDRYVISHPGWQADIPAGSSCSYGFVAQSFGSPQDCPVSCTVNGIQCVVNGGPAPVPPPPEPPAPEPPPAPVPPPQPGPGAALARVVFQKTSDWGSGYCADVTIENISAADINGWRLQFTLDSQITSLWNGVLGGTRPEYSVLNESWNALVAKGSKVSIGFTGAYSGTFRGPEGFTLNGVPCLVGDDPAPTPEPPAPEPPAPEPQPPSPPPESGVITIRGIDGTTPVDQFTVGQGSTDLALSVPGVNSPSLRLATNNTSVIGCTMKDPLTLRVNGLKAGRASLRLTETKSGRVRYVGVRVRTSDGRLPGMPDYVSVGSVSEDTTADLAFWRDFGDGAANKRVDVRYIYLCGGPVNGWRTWSQQDGGRAITFIRESKKLGMIPFFVYYNIPDGGESYWTDRQHIESAEYMQAYYRDLDFFLDTAKRESGDEMVGIVLEPDFLGYMMQQSGGSSPVPPGQIQAKTSAAYSSGVLDRSVDPVFPDTVAGLVDSINYLISKRLPNACFGWQFNLWASPGITTGIPGNGLMRITDRDGMVAGRNAIVAEGGQIAAYYRAAGVTSYGADFVSIDKYGLDAGISSPSDPSKSIWFWNADHWNNYLLFCRTLKEKTGLPVVLWQIPVGHVNRTGASNPYPGTGGVFADLTNTSQHYEDSAPDFFLGDSFKPGTATRLEYFKTNRGGDQKVGSSGDTVTWGSHMAEARDNGVVAVLFGAGVGDSTDGVGSPPTDGYWWISRVQAYFNNPVSLQGLSGSTVQGSAAKGTAAKQKARVRTKKRRVGTAR